MHSVRVWFSKTGSARYISHLDLMRCMTRAARRAGLPVWYTQGFNSRAYMTFALPLSLGISGLRESMDLRLEEALPNEEVCRRLDAVLPADIHVFDATDPVMKPGAIAYATYILRIPAKQLDTLAQEIRALFACDPLPVKKRSKHGMLEMNLHPELDRTTVTTEPGAVRVDTMLPAGGDFNLNPTLLVDCITRNLGELPTVSITRTGLWTADQRPFA